MIHFTIPRCSCWDSAQDCIKPISGVSAALETTPEKGCLSSKADLDSQY